MHALAKLGLVGLGLVALLGLAHADMYMQNPRGSNNRLNEKSANRANGNRLFDSQNNNRGGYNVGDATEEAFDEATPFAPFAETMDPTNDSRRQYQMAFYEGSELSLSWTNQHGAGGNEESDVHKLNSDIIVQMMCDTDSSVTDRALQVKLRDGGNTGTPDAPNAKASDLDAELDATEGRNIAEVRGHHESEAFYLECQLRKRNKGLFTADQKLRRNTAQYTRQNPNGNRRGLECPEERDYYPYWSPSPWRDVAIFTDFLDSCEERAQNSQNVKTVFKCVDTSGNYDAEIVAAITQAECEALATAEGGSKPAEWKGFSHGMPAPPCLPAEWSRVNHLGNGRNGQPIGYNWTLPLLSELPNVDKTGGVAKCVLRMRYNISTDDYDPWKTDASFNEDKAKGVRSPVEQNPVVSIHAELQGMRLAINTAQFGRTFQDRSHVFYIRERPSKWDAKKIFNLNVRGKRGNIVQTFPATEYDFHPTRIQVKEGDLIHVQWTGSNTHNNGNPAGDGQAGDAGEGKGGTDRHNMVPSAVEGENWPQPLDTGVYNGQPIKTFFDAATCYWATASAPAMTELECQLTLATSGYYRSEADAETKPQMSALLDNAPASLVGGVVLRMDEKGSFHTLCTRNNNFSNRSQKGTIVVV